MPRWVACLVLAAACATGPRAVPPGSPVPPPGEPLAAGLTALASEQWARADECFAAAETQRPDLADYALYFRARAAVRAGHARAARDALDRLLATRPDSVWTGAAHLLAGEQALAGDQAEAARAHLVAARAHLAPGGTGSARATLALARALSDAGDPAGALEHAESVRRERPRSLGARRARRLAGRIRAAHPALPPPEPLPEAEQLLREGDARGARAEAERALAGDVGPEARTRALWVRAQAERATGDRAAAEATCLTLARAAPADPLAARALAAAASWRWNANDDTGAALLFEEVVERHPESPSAPDALYALGRISQEAGRWDEAFVRYRRVAERYPTAKVADEAAWRAGWVRWLGEDWAGATAAFAAAGGGDTTRAAAAYWRARALARQGRRADAATAFARLAEEQPLSYYAGLAETRLGRPAPHGQPPVADPAPPFPPTLAGPHADRARVLADLGLTRFARRELDAVDAASVPPEDLLAAYAALGAPADALRLARRLGAPDGDPAVQRYLYPLGYWDVVRPAAEARGVDPFLVVALIRQESLFDPHAASPADAHGLMQLLPGTARALGPAGAPPPSRADLHHAATNVDLGATLLARLLARHQGSSIRALAAYNAGDDAVARWEARYGEREDDEFVELISYRETRDYVKAVLRNYRVYRALYATPPSASVISRGSPPKAPLDITAMTSPGRAEPTK